MIEVVHQRGTVAELHGLDPFTDGPPVPAVWWCDPADDAIVLGSRQQPEVLDLAACRRRGLSVVKRRSGGGAVLLSRDSVIWVDVVLPTGFAPDDIRGSMVWIGEHWRAALVGAGCSAAELSVHRGPMVDHPWSDLVCFAGIGPGEVLRGSDKLVGLSQRRTRHGLRIQSLIYTTSVAATYRSLLAPPLPESEPPGQTWWADADARRLVPAFADRITPL